MMNDIQYNARGEMYILSVMENPADILVRKCGKFYKGYSPDLLEFDTKCNIVELSRNGLMKTLPEGLFFDEEYLKGVLDLEQKKSRASEVKESNHKMSVFFEAFDNVFFQEELALQQRVDTTESELDYHVLKEFYNIDLKRHRNSLVRKLACMLLDGDVLKGNLYLLPFGVRTILKAKTACRVSRYVVDDESAATSRKVEFIVYIDNLSNAEYRRKMEDYEEFFYYLEDWFLPFDCEVDYCIKDIHQLFRLGEQLTLDYNTQI